MRIFALVDCNNFYVSCERLFRPSLRNKPVVVLSNNDGCVIARSQEAKEIGIPMAAPEFKYRSFFQHHNVEVFSSNYSLYGDISQRVTETLYTLTPQMEVYSIDESFLEFPPGKISDLLTIGREIRHKVFKWTGIPVSVGFGPTKTLAKAANRFAKKEAWTKGVFNLCNINVDEQLEKIPVTDVWGIGYRHGKRLISRGVTTARIFKDLPDLWIKKNMAVTGLHTALELRGTPCFSLAILPSPKRQFLPPALLDVLYPLYKNWKNPFLPMYPEPEKNYASRNHSPPESWFTWKPTVIIIYRSIQTPQRICFQWQQIILRI